MPEEGQQGQQQGHEQNSNESADQQRSSQSNGANSNADAQGSGSSESGNSQAVPYHRFQEVNKRAREAEQRAQKLEQEKAEREENQAQAQGEYQKLAEQRKETIGKKDTRIKDLENQITQGERYRAFVSASQGIILPEALDDAFSMLTDEEFKNADVSDINTYRSLADNLAERKPFLADSLRGSGSGGSSRPVFSRGARNGEAPKRGESPFGKATSKPPYR